MNASLLANSNHGDNTSVFKKIIIYLYYYIIFCSYIIFHYNYNSIILTFKYISVSNTLHLLINMFEYVTST